MGRIFRRKDGQDLQEKRWAGSSGERMGMQCHKVIRIGRIERIQDSKDLVS